jgi:hypothetical protein
MKKYKFFPQKENMCLAACIQSILDSRNLEYESQQEISEKFIIGKNGINLDEELLNEFLMTYELNSIFQNPFETILEPDYIIKAVTKNKQNGIDVLISYDYAKLHEIDKEKAGHFSLLSGFSDIEDKVYVHDNLTAKIEQYSLPDLINSMSTFSNSGFYFIGRWRDLERLDIFD